MAWCMLVLRYYREIQAKYRAKNVMERVFIAVAYIAHMKSYNKNENISILCT